MGCWRLGGIKGAVDSDYNSSITLNRLFLPFFQLSSLSCTFLFLFLLATSSWPCPHFLITAVKSIKKQQLVEVRSLNNPPKMVKMAMESICLLIGEPTKEWRSIRSILIRENFIPTIINFSTEDITLAACTFLNQLHSDFICGFLQQLYL